MIEPGVITISLVSSKHGNLFKVFATENDRVAQPVPSLEEYDGFRDGAPEGVHVWEMAVLVSQDLKPIEPGANLYNLPLGGGNLTLTGIASQDLIDDVEKSMNAQ